MGWLWNSSKAQPAAAAKSDNDFVEHVPSTVIPLGVPEPPKKPLSREEQATLEFNALLKEFQEQSEVDKDVRGKVKGSGAFEASPVPTDISPDTLYPTEMSCRSSFDYAMFCQSFGGQFVNVYRYGSFRSCSNHWDDFWLCMRTRNWDEKDKSKAIQDHYKKRATKWKTGPSSEDIWEVRTEPVKDAFQENLEDLEARISDWKKANPGVPDPWLKQQGATFNNPAQRAA